MRAGALRSARWAAGLPASRASRLIAARAGPAPQPAQRRDQPAHAAALDAPLDGQQRREPPAQPLALAGHQRLALDARAQLAQHARVERGARQRLAPSHLAQRRGHDRPLLLPGGPAAGGGQRAPAQAVQQRAIGGQQVERPAGAARVVPLDHEPVLAVLDVFVMARHSGHDARRAQVEALQRRPEHALHARELEHDVGVRVVARQLLLAQRPHDLVRAVEAARGADHRQMPRGLHRRRRRERLRHALEPHVRVALHQDAQRLVVAAHGRRRRRGEDVLGHAVAHQQAAPLRRQRLQRLGDPARLGDDRQRQLVRDRRGQPLPVLRPVEAVLERLHEVGVPVRRELERRSDGLPPGGHGHVVVGGARDVHPVHRDVLEPAEAPVGIVLVAGQHQVDREPVPAGQLPRMLDDDADPARQLKVVDDERDPHGKSSGVVVGSRPSCPSS